MKRVLYIVPGFREDRTSRPAYKQIEKIFKAKRFAVRHVPIKWNHGTMNTYTRELKNFVLKHSKSSEEVYLLGFSFGSMASLMMGKVLGAKAIILCSLSPYFKQDLKEIPKKWHLRNSSELDKRRFKVFSKIDFDEVIKNFNIKTFILYGTLENKVTQNRAKETHKKIKNSELIPVPNAKHDINDEDYQKAIKKIAEFV